MALSQKHFGKSVVPWFCSNEWKLVFHKIYGPNHTDSTMQEALDIICIWKARTPLLPRGVEGTYIMLEAILLDRSLYDSYNLQLLLSTSVMRFLNICAAYDKRQGTFYQTARKINLPEWLINLRHTIAHGQMLPPIYLLNKALLYCLDWVHTAYWKAAESEIKDFIDDMEFQSDKYENLKFKIQPLISHFSYITLLTHPYWGYTHVNNIINEEAKEEFLEELRELAGLENVNNNTLLSTIQNMIWKNIEQALSDYEDVDNKNDLVAELLLEEDIFLGNFDESTDIFEDSDSMPSSFIKIWEKLLVKMHKSHMIGGLIENLLHIITLDTENARRKSLASIWLLEIGKGLVKSVFAYDLATSISEKDNTLAKTEIITQVQKIIKSKYEDCILTFKVRNYLPDIITDASKFKTHILETANEYTKIFISEYLDLNNTFRPKKNKEQIVELINIYLPSEDSTICTSSKIHTVEDLISSSMDVDSEVDNTNKQDDFLSEKSEEEFQSNKIWRKVEGFAFERYPIGILPWQTSLMNPLLQ